MAFEFETRLFESPLVAWTWRTRSDHASGDAFISSAATQCEMVFTRLRGELYVHLRGPESKASRAPIPQDAEFFGITFTLGAFLAHLSTESLVDGGTNLPLTAGNGSRRFWLNGAAWEVPTFDNADVFLNRLSRQGILTRDPVVDAALRGQQIGVSARTAQRRFLRAVGLTHGTVAQIERARHARTLLEAGIPILDVVEQAGYADQPHLTRALKHYVGYTPAQLIRA